MLSILRFPITVLRRLTGRIRPSQPESRVVPMTMADVAAQRHEAFGNSDRTPCACPTCRTARNEATRVREEAA